jgi:hypothetical protein
MDQMLMNNGLAKIQMEAVTAIIRLRKHTANLTNLSDI